MRLRTVAKFESSLIEIIVLGANILDGFGAVVIMVVASRAIIEFFIRLKTADYDVIRLNLIRGLALGLEFKIGSSILKTVAITRLIDVELLAAILLIRTFLVFVIRREIKDARDMTSTSPGIVSAKPSPTS